MEASQYPSNPQDQPTTPSEQAADAQQEPTQDSGLQTPQPDQPVPTEAEPQADPEPVQAQTAEVGPSGQVAEGFAEPASYPTNEDLHAQEQAKQEELESAQREHNERTGGGEVQPGELQAQRDEHNARVAGESVDQSSEADQA